MVVRRRTNQERFGSICGRSVVTSFIGCDGLFHGEPDLHADGFPDQTVGVRYRNAASDECDCWLQWQLVYIRLFAQSVEVPSREHKTYCLNRRIPGGI